MLTSTPLVSYSSIKTQPNPYTHARIHPYPLLQPSHLSLRGTKMTTKLFFKYRPTGQIRGSNLRVKRNGLAGQGDPTRTKPVSHGSIGRWRVGWGRVGSGDFQISRVGSGQQFFKSRSGRVESRGLQNLAARVGSSQHTPFLSWVGSGRVSPTDPTRPVRFDLTREKP